jgi:monofunctional biosynthetic peptidoglycan transglycosylase
MLALAGVVALFYLLVAIAVAGLRWVDPPLTAVQMQRQVEAWSGKKAYRRVYQFVPLSRISPELQHAAVAAEDARFYQHHGFDWTEVENAIEEDREGIRTRGASTITQQLVKNLFLTTNRSWIRKGIEFTIVPLVEGLLTKRRILELYLNVIEWGPGIFGAEAAANFHYHVPARGLTREQAIQLAAVLPAPLRRKPGRMTEYGEIIEGRMEKMGW